MGTGISPRSAETHVLSRLFRLGLRRGLMGGSRRWLFMGLMAGLGKLLARMAKSQREIVYREELKPGETVVIDHQAAASRRRR